MRDWSRPARVYFTFCFMLEVLVNRILFYLQLMQNNMRGTQDRNNMISDHLLFRIMSFFFETACSFLTETLTADLYLFPDTGYLLFLIRVFNTQHPTKPNFLF